MHNRHASLPSQTGEVGICEFCLYTLEFVYTDVGLTDKDYAGEGIVDDYNT